MRFSLNDLSEEQLRAYQDRIGSEIASLEKSWPDREEDNSERDRGNWRAARDRLHILQLARIGVAREIADWPSVHPGAVSDNG